MDLAAFKIGFDPRDKKRVYEYWDEVFSSQKWIEGKFAQLFEEKWEKWNGLPAVATSSWAGAAMACLEYFQVRGKKVLCPTNTFMATPLSAVKAGAEVVFGEGGVERTAQLLQSAAFLAGDEPVGRGVEAGRLGSRQPGGDPPSTDPVKRAPAR